MDYTDSNKRLKSANGTPVAVSQGAAGLRAYQPPAAIGARGVARYVMHAGFFVCLRDAAGAGVADHVRGAAALDLGRIRPDGAGAASAGRRRGTDEEGAEQHARMSASSSSIPRA